MSSLDRKFDKIKQAELKGLIRQKKIGGGRFWSKWRNNSLAMAGSIIVLVVVLAAIFAPVISPYEMDAISLKERLSAPSWEHPLGTDQLGRDMLTRLIYGSRVSVLVGLGGACGGAIIGIILGCIGGYYGGLFDRIVLRISEIFTCFPQLVLILILVAAVGQGVDNLIIIFTVTGWMGMYRLVRAQFLSLREEGFVEALVAFGVSKASIMFRHILPNTLAPITVSLTLSTAGYILSEAGLSFLGLGVPIEVPTWGNILSAAQDVTIMRESWWMWVPAGITVSLFVMGVNFIGDGLRDVVDPNQQG